MNNLKMKLSSNYNSIKRSKIVQNIFYKNYKKFLKKIGNLCNHKDITVRKCIVLSKDSYININTTVVNSFLCGLDCSLVVTFELFLKL